MPEGADVETHFSDPLIIHVVLDMCWSEVDSSVGSQMGGCHPRGPRGPMETPTPSLNAAIFTVFAAVRAVDNICTNREAH